MKLTALLGSPRKRGNSTALAQAFLEQAIELGVESEVFRLNQLKYRGCQGCYKCKTDKDRCVLDDDLRPVLASLAEADLWLVASPIYFGQTSGLLKSCLDRWFSFLKPDYMDAPDPSRLTPGKQSVWILTQGRPEDSFAQVFPGYADFLQWFGFRENHLLRAASTGHGGAIDFQPEQLAQARELARRLLGQAA